MAITGTLLQLLAFAAIGSASIHASPFEVQLVPFNESTITAVITNKDQRGYNLLHRNSILDLNPSRKIRVSSPDHREVPFRGLHRFGCAHAAHAGPSEDEFTAIAAGQTLYRDLDLAEMYDLESDTYDIFADGSLPYADADSFSLSGDAVSFSSNVLELPLTLPHTSLTKRTGTKRRRKRTSVTDCSSEQTAIITAASQGCVDLASAAAEAAVSGDVAMFEKYFKDSSEATRNKVADVYRSVAQECATTPGGTSTSQCTDPHNYCSGTLIAYTYWQTGGGMDPVRDLYYCPRYFDVMPAESSQCHSQSQATNTLHEMTHAMAATDDHAYGMEGIMRLSSEQAVTNADTYALYATDLDLNCGGGGRPQGGSPAGWSGQGGSSGSWEGAPSGMSSQDESNDSQGPPPNYGQPEQDVSAQDGQQGADGSSGQEASHQGTYTWADLIAWFRQHRWGQ